MSVFLKQSNHRINDALTLFIKSYSEEETAAITIQPGGAAETCKGCRSRQIIAASLRYDFTSK